MNLKKKIMVSVVAAAIVVATMGISEHFLNQAEIRFNQRQEAELGAKQFRQDVQPMLDSFYFEHNLQAGDMALHAVALERARLATYYHGGFAHYLWESNDPIDQKNVPLVVMARDNLQQYVIVSGKITYLKDGDCQEELRLVIYTFPHKKGDPRRRVDENGQVSAFINEKWLVDLDQTLADKIRAQAYLALIDRPLHIL